MSRSCECGNEPSTSIKLMERLDKLSKYTLLKKDSVIRASLVSQLVMLKRIL